MLVARDPHTGGSAHLRRRDRVHRSGKAGKLEDSLDLPGQPSRPSKRLEIERIESLGRLDVYDIQTESGEYLSASLRVHNCFILAVDDSMDSILNWYREEGDHLQGRLRRRRQPLAHPVVGRGAPGRRHGVGPGVLHAGCGRLGGHDQVRWQDPACGQDGDPRRRPPRHRGLHLVQGPRGAQGPRAARRRLRHGPRRARRIRSSTRTPTTPSGSPTSSCRPSSTIATGT